MIIGHGKILDFFENAIKSGNLSHAYCFIGPDQIGKRTVALQVSAKILNTEIEKVSEHADYYYLERLTDEKTGKLKKDISIEQIRDLKKRMQHSSWSGKYQVVIIEGAEQLRRASNSILKLLEEPAEKSVIFLISNKREDLLPTIRSRCQIINFSIVTDEIIKKGLLDRGHEDRTATEAVELSWGRPGRALGFLQNVGAKELYQKELKRWQDLIGQPFHIKLKLVDELFGDKTDAIRDREKIQDVLDIWIVLWRRVLLGHGADDILLKKIGAENIINIIDSLFAAKKMLEQNIHPRLIIEQILLKF